MSADKFYFKHRFSIFQEHFHHFAKVRIELVQRDGLGVGSRESGNVTHVETGLRISFDNRRVFSHGTETFSLDLAQTEKLTRVEPQDGARGQGLDQGVPLAGTGLNSIC